jgi:hypothetical protein
LLSFGGRASPAGTKNFSCPDGAHMQSRRAGLSELFLNERWGIFTLQPPYA